MGFLDFLFGKKKPEAFVGISRNVPAGAPAQDSYAFRGSAEEYFSRLLAGCFPEYTVQRNVVLGMFGEASRPISFLLTRGNQAVLAIIICHSQEYKNKPIRNTVSECQTRGIPVQRYFEDFRNDAEYVCNRIRTVLR